MKSDDRFKQISRSHVRSTFSITIAGAIFVLVAIAAFIQLDILVSTSGHIEAQRKLEPVRAYTGGIITHIKRHAGESVTAGETLVQLSSIAEEAELQEIEKKLSRANEELILISALLSNEDPVLSDRTFLPLYNLYKRKSISFQSGLKELEQTQSLLQNELTIQRIAVNIAALDVGRNRILFDAQSELNEKGIVSKNVTDQFELSLNIAENELQKQKYQIQLKKIQIEKHTSHIDNYKNKYTEELTSLQSKILSKIDEYDTIKSSLLERISNKNITSPISGVVQQRLSLSKGSAVQDGDIIYQIMPNNNGFYFTTRLASSDVGFVNVGDLVNIRVDAFPFWSFGYLRGKVGWISDDAILVVGGENHFIVHVVLESENNPKLMTMPLRAGMSGIADIKIGTRSIWEYFIGTILQASSVALRER